MKNLSIYLMLVPVALLAGCSNGTPPPMTVQQHSREMRPLQERIDAIQANGNIPEDKKQEAIAKMKANNPGQG